MKNQKVYIVFKDVENIRFTLGVFANQTDAQKACERKGKGPYKIVEWDVQ